jgi:hypothetical protein
MYEQPNVHGTANRSDSSLVYAMEQQNTAPYVSSPYPNMMDLPSSHLPLRSAPNGPTTPRCHEHSFDESSYFSTVPQEISNFPISRVAESSLDPWLMDIPGTASPDSSRLSMSPSQGIATPSSGGFYSPPYPEQLQLPAYQLLEQPQPVRSCSTSHPNWVNSDDNWERTYAESDLWSTQPFVAQPWVPNTYDGYAPQDMHLSHPQASINSLLPYTFTAQNQSPLLEPVRTEATTGSHTGEVSEDADSSDEESDWDDDASDYSQSESSTSKPKPKGKAPCVRQDRWMIPTCIIQPETRAYGCNVPDCTAAFVRPEHLRRHYRSKHSGLKDFFCVVPGCETKPFSRGDNLRDHYWTHVERGGRSGKNRKYPLEELREILGLKPKERKLIRKLKIKLNQHHEKEKLKKGQRPSRPAYVVRSML